MLTEIIKDEKKKIHLIYAIFSILWIVENFLCLRRGDDTVVLSYVQDFGFFKAVSRHIGIGNWSTRFLVDFLSYFLIGVVPFSVWRILNTGVTVALLFFLDRMLNENKKSSYTLMATGILFLFPYIFENTAGWIFTTVTYYWTVMTSVAFIYFMNKLYISGKVTLKDKIICFLCLIYSCDIETCCIFIIVLLFFMGIDFWLKNKKVPCLLIASFVTALLRLSLHLIWGSFGHRKISEISIHFPDYIQMSLLDKIQEGFTTAWYVYIVSHPTMMLLLAISLFAAVFSIRKDLLSRIISSMAFLFLCICKMCSFIGKRFDFGILNTFLRMNNGYDRKYGFITSQNFYQLQSYVAIVMWFVILASIAFSIFCIFTERKQAFTNFGLLLAGLLSRMVLGFSPTCAVSFFRTHVFLAIAILIVLARTLVELRKSNKKLSSVIWAICIICGFISFAILVISTGRMMSEDVNAISIFTKL